jgi:hypothetical protein
MTAATALPAIFKALMTTFQKPADYIRRRHRGARALLLELIPEAEAAQSRQK